MPVGIFDKAAKLFRYSANTGFSDSGTNVVSSPWALGAGLAPVLGIEAGIGAPVTEAESLRVPPVIRALSQYLAAAAPLRFTAESGTAPAWMNATIDALTPGNRLASMVQDLIFHGETLLWVQRDPDGEITDGLHLPHHLWTADWLGHISVGDMSIMDQRQFVYIKGYLPQGLLEYAADSIRNYAAVQRTIRARGENPVPLIELHVEDPDELEPEELKKAQADWAMARQAPNGAVAFTPKGIKLIVHNAGNSDYEHLLGARNAIRLDIANFMNLDAGMVDGASGRSQDYSNSLQHASEFVRLSLPLFLDPIQQRLSQPDIVPAGTILRLDTTAIDTLSETAQGNLGTATAPAIEGNTTA